jgi:hypothetical protein
MPMLKHPRSPVSASARSSHTFSNGTAARIIGPRPQAAFNEEKISIDSDRFEVFHTTLRLGLQST